MRNEDHMIEYYTRKLKKASHLEIAVREYIAVHIEALDLETLEDLVEQIKDIHSGSEYDSDRLRERVEMQQAETHAVDANSEIQTEGETHVCQEQKQ